MQTLTIQQIVADAANGLRVVPAAAPSEIFDAVYRAANSVRWEGAQHSFVMVPRVDGSRRTPPEAFEQIRSAIARECGLRLTLSDKTNWTGLSPTDEAAIRAQVERTI